MKQEVFCRYASILLLCAVLLMVFSLSILPWEVRRNLWDYYGLWGVGVSKGEWIRLITSGFLHMDWSHSLGNMSFIALLALAANPRLAIPECLGFVFASCLLIAAINAWMDRPVYAIGSSGGVSCLNGYVFLSILRPRCSLDVLANKYRIAITLITLASFPPLPVPGHTGGLLAHYLGFLTGCFIGIMGLLAFRAGYRIKHAVYVICAFEVIAAFGIYTLGIRP